MAERKASSRSGSRPGAAGESGAGSTGFDTASELEVTQAASYDAITGSGASAGASGAGATGDISASEERVTRADGGAWSPGGSRDTAANDVSGSASAAKRGANQLVDRVKARATEQISSQKDRATDGLGAVAEAVRHTTRHLREGQHEDAARYVEMAADQLERLSSALREKDVNELLDDAQRLARRQPALFVGGAFAVGFAAARFLKSSQRDEERWSNARDSSEAGSVYGGGHAYGSGGASGTTRGYGEER